MSYLERATMILFTLFLQVWMVFKKEWDVLIRKIN